MPKVAACLTTRGAWISRQCCRKASGGSSDRRRRQMIIFCIAPSCLGVTLPQPSGAASIAVRRTTIRRQDRLIRITLQTLQVAAADPGGRALPLSPPDLSFLLLTSISRSAPHRNRPQGLAAHLVAFTGKGREARHGRTSVRLLAKGGRRCPNGL